MKNINVLIIRSFNKTWFLEYIGVSKNRCVIDVTLDSRATRLVIVTRSKFYYKVYVHSFINMSHDTGRK